MCQCRRHLITAASGSVCTRNLFPFKVLNYILTPQFLLFYFALYICVGRGCIAVVGRSILVLFLTINY